MFVNGHGCSVVGNYSGSVCFGGENNDLFLQGCFESCFESVLCLFSNEYNNTQLVIRIQLMRSDHRSDNAVCLMTACNIYGHVYLPGCGIIVIFQVPDWALFILVSYVLE